jgi:hypothetical protein
MDAIVAKNTLLPKDVLGRSLVTTAVLFELRLGLPFVSLLGLPSATFGRGFLSKSCTTLSFEDLALDCLLEELDRLGGRFKTLDL